MRVVDELGWSTNSCMQQRIRAKGPRDDFCLFATVRLFIDVTMIFFHRRLCAGTDA